MQFSANYICKGEGMPFYFQHGLGSNLSQPQSLLSEVKNVQLISMDCPGHGASPLTDSALPSFDHYTDQLKALMEKLNIEKAIFGGISMGAAMAMNMALRFPERVKALVLVRPAWLDRGTPENLAILLEAAKMIGKKNGQATFEQRADFQYIKKSLPNAAQSVLGVFAPTQRAEIPLVLEKMVKDKPFSKLEELEKIDKPCLVIGNEDDPLHPFEMAESIHKRIPGSLCEKVVSRYVNNESHKKTVNQLVSKFINNL